MKWEKWYFQKGESTPSRKSSTNVIVAFQEGLVIRRESKNKMVRLMEKSPSATIVWSPSTERGWGASAFNKNCWRTIEGGPIIPQEIRQVSRDVRRTEER